MNDSQMKGQMFLNQNMKKHIDTYQYVKSNWDLIEHAVSDEIEPF